MNIVQPTTAAGTPSLATSTATPTPAAPIAAVSGTLLAAGLAVAQIAPGALLRAIVTGRNEAGQLLLDFGKTRGTLATQANLPAGSEVVLQVKGSGSRIPVAVLPVAAEGQHAAARQGQAPPAGTAAAASAAQPVPAAEPPEAAVQQMLGLSTSAVVVAGPPDEAVATGAPPAGEPPAPAPGATAPPPPLAAGTSLSIRILAAAPPGQPVPAGLMPADTAGRPLPAVVAALTAAGHPLVQTQAGLLLLGAKLAVPIGAALLIELPPDADAAGAAASASSDPAAHSGPQPAQTPFPRLGQALETMRLAGLPSPPGLAGHLPHTGPRLAEGLMAALAAARDDDPAAGLDRLLRPALEHLGQGDVADGVRQELTRAAALAGQTAQADWRVYLLPLLDDGRLHQLRIYERQQRGRPGGGAVPGSRFVVEVELSRLGAIQLDGLVQPRRFDLMVRSREPLSEAMRRDITAIFAEARASTGFAGEIGFQQTAVFPVNPKTAEGPGAGVVV